MQTSRKILFRFLRSLLPGLFLVFIFCQLASANSNNNSYQATTLQQNSTLQLDVNHCPGNNSKPISISLDISKDISNLNISENGINTNSGIRLNNTVELFGFCIESVDGEAIQEIEDIKSNLRTLARGENNFRPVSSVRYDYNSEERLAKFYYLTLNNHSKITDVLTETELITIHDKQLGVSSVKDKRQKLDDIQARIREKIVEYRSKAGRYAKIYNINCNDEQQVRFVDEPLFCIRSGHDEENSIERAQIANQAINRIIEKEINPESIELIELANLPSSEIQSSNDDNENAAVALISNSANLPEKERIIIEIFPLDAKLEAVSARPNDPVNRTLSSDDQNVILFDDNLSTAQLAAKYLELIKTHLEYEFYGKEHPVLFDWGLYGKKLLEESEQLRNSNNNFIGSSNSEALFSVRDAGSHNSATNRADKISKNIRSISHAFWPYFGKLELTILINNNNEDRDFFEAYQKETCSDRNDVDCLLNNLTDAEQAQLSAISQVSIARKASPDPSNISYENHIASITTQDVIANAIGEKYLENIINHDYLARIIGHDMHNARPFTEDLHETLDKLEEIDEDKINSFLRNNSSIEHRIRLAGNILYALERRINYFRSENRWIQLRCVALIILASTIFFFFQKSLWRQKTKRLQKLKTREVGDYDNGLFNFSALSVVLFLALLVIISLFHRRYPAFRSLPLVRNFDIGILEIQEYIGTDFLFLIITLIFAYLAWVIVPYVLNFLFHLNSNLSAKFDFTNTSKELQNHPYTKSRKRATKWIVRAAIVIIAILLASPHLPGSGTIYLAGISAFAALAFSLSASSLITDVIAGIVIIYLTPIDEGCWIEVQGIIGEVKHQSMFAHHIETSKGILVTIANRTVLDCMVFNYNPFVQDRILLSTSVTIGYDVHFEKVETCLLYAATLAARELQSSRAEELRNHKDVPAGEGGGGGSQYLEQARAGREHGNNNEGNDSEVILYKKGGGIYENAGMQQNIVPVADAFVLQVSLDDFYVSYELNVWINSKEAKNSRKIISVLHKNIQHVFHFEHVEILSPHYEASRNEEAHARNKPIIPDEYWNI